MHDKYGVQHNAEDDNQAWRRFPMIICLREEDFDVLINQGFVNHDLRSIKTMQMFAHVRGSMKAVQERLSGAAKDQMLLNFGRPVLEAKKVIDDSHEEKISDPALIPAEFADYGTVETGPEYEARIAKEKEAAAEAAAKKKVKRYQKALSDFGHWFWYCSSVFRNAWHDYPMLVMDDHQDDRLQYLRGLTRFCFDEADPDSEMPVIDIGDEIKAVPALTKDELLRAFDAYLRDKGIGLNDNLLHFQDNVGPLVDALLAGLVGRTAGVTDKDYDKRKRQHADDIKAAKRIMAEVDYKAAIVNAVKAEGCRPYIIPTEDPDVYYTRSTPQTQWEKDEEAGVPHVYDPNSTDRNY